MNNTTDMQRTLDRLEELRSIFVLGQRAVPFIEEVVLLIKDMSPLLNTINGSILDSASKLPGAFSQLESVSQATEMATTEILNLVDLALMKCNELGKRIESTGKHVDAVRGENASFKQVLEQTLGAGWSAVATAYEAHALTQESSLRAIEISLDVQLEAVNVLKVGMTQIMMSLQVQDITSQQIASVNHLILTTRERLNKLTENLGARPIDSEEVGIRLQSGATFDSNARYKLPGLREVTEREVTEPEVAKFDSTGDFATMGDIDALFANQ